MRNVRHFVALALVAALTLLLAVPASAAPPAAGATFPVEGTLADGGSFVGDVTLDRVSVDDGQLMVSGVLNGTATQTENGTTTTTDVVDQVFRTALDVTASQDSCDILFLDLGPIFLDVLGLTVDLSQIVLDVNAVPGAGNLLGNLLCAVAGLLDGPSGTLSGIAGLLNRILGVLGG